MAAPDLDETGIRDLVPIASSQESGSRVSAFLVKLTDSSLQALKANEKLGGEPCRIEMSSDGGVLAFPNTGTEGKNKPSAGKYTFTLWDMRERDLGVDGRMEVISGVSDGHQLEALGCESEPGFGFVGGIHRKIQMNATEASFDETRKKALQLQEEEQKRSAAKEVKHKGMKQPQKKPSPLPPTEASQSSSNSASSSAALSKTAGKPLRQRLVHLFAVTQIFNKTEALDRLKKEGLTSSDEKRFDAVLADVTAKVGPKLILKPSLLKTEVDQNWPSYSTYEKSVLNRKLKGKEQGRSSPPESYVGFQKKTEPLPPQAPQPKMTILDDLLPNDGERENGGKRRNGPTPPHDAEVTPPNTSPGAIDLMPVQKKVRTAHNAQGPVSTSSPKEPSVQPPLPDEGTAIPNPPPPVDTPHPRDWSEEFPPIQSLEERKKYGVAFQADYDEYGRCHEKLAAVGREFGELEHRLLKAPKETKERKKIEHEIVTKYQHYLKDAEFMSLKRRHDELRGKLGFIKERVKEFDLKERKRIVAEREAKKLKKSSDQNRQVIVKDPPPFHENNRATDLTVM